MRGHLAVTVKGSGGAVTVLLKHYVKGLWFVWPLWQRTSARKHADSANAAGFTRNDWLELSEVLSWAGCILLLLFY